MLRLVSYAYMPSPLPRQVQWSLFARLSPLSVAFPVKKSGRLLQLFFRGLLSVHSRYGLHARGVAKRPFTPKAPTAPLPRLPLRLLPGGANQFPGGSYIRWSPAPFTAHCYDSYRGRRCHDTEGLGRITLRTFPCERASPQATYPRLLRQSRRQVAYGQLAASETYS